MELYHRYTFQMPDGTISARGIREIQGLITRQQVQTGVWFEMHNGTFLPYHLPSLPVDWQWLWKVQRGEYRGTFPKRVAQYYKKRHDLKCPEVFLTELGTLARRYSADQESYEFEITNDFEWGEGEFGDDGSCLYDDRAGAWQMLRDGGALAICFYDGYRGIARAFLYDADTYHVIFNGYGIAGDATFEIAKIFAAWRGDDMKKIRVTNRGDYHGVLWVNDGGHGYAVGKTESLADLLWHDFDWDSIYSRRCYHCDNIVSEDETALGPDDNRYCDSCFSDLFAYCEICDQAHWREDLIYVDDRDICPDCLRDEYTDCHECGEHIHRSKARIRGGLPYCETCLAALPDPKKK